MTRWRVLIDIDGHQVPDPNNGVDGAAGLQNSAFPQRI
jgi:hypothetical protein